MARPQAIAHAGWCAVTWRRGCRGRMPLGHASPRDDVGGLRTVPSRRHQPVFLPADAAGGDPRVASCGAHEQKPLHVIEDQNSARSSVGRDARVPRTACWFARRGENTAKAQGYVGRLPASLFDPLPRAARRSYHHVEAHGAPRSAHSLPALRVNSHLLHALLSRGSQGVLSATTVVIRR